MDADDSESPDSVSVSVELTGRYDEVLSKLETDDPQSDGLAPVLADLREILATVDRIDGGTRSAVADELPADTTADYDPEAIVTALQLLGAYGLVSLDGNSWYPCDRGE